jgi:hypothetical protein
MRRTPLTCALATSCLVLLGACGTSTTSTRAAPTTATTAKASAEAATAPPHARIDGVAISYLGPIPHSEYDAETTVSLSVPPTSDQPGISWQKAAANCFTSAGICARGEGQVRISLAVGYYPNSGETEPDGSIDPTMNHVLVYVLAQNMGPCASAGPGPGARYPSCTALTFTDAHTGGGRAAMSGPSLRDPSAA